MGHSISTLAMNWHRPFLYKDKQSSIEVFQVISNGSKN